MAAPAPPSPDPCPPPCCPSCASCFRVAPHPHAPVALLPCAHSVCGLCGDAVLAGGGPCPVCQTPIVSTHPNVALGEAGEAAAAASIPPPAACEDCAREAADDAEYEVSPAVAKCAACDKKLCTLHGATHGKRRGHDASVPLDGAPIVARPAHDCQCATHAGNPISLFCNTDNTVMCGLCLAEGHLGHEFVKIAVATDALTAKVRALVDECARGADTLLRAIPDEEETKAALGIAKTAALSTLDSIASSLKTAVDAQCALLAQAVTDVYDERTKAVGVRLDTLTVSAAQLRSCGSVCGAALRGDSPVALARASQCGACVRTLATPPGPPVCPVIRVVANTDAVIAAIAAVATLDVGDPPAGVPVVSGTDVSSVGSDEASENTDREEEVAERADAAERRVLTVRARLQVCVRVCVCVRASVCVCVIG